MSGHLWTDRRMDGQTEVTLNAPAIVMGGGGGIKIGKFDFLKTYEASHYSHLICLTNDKR